MSVGAPPEAEFRPSGRIEVQLGHVGAERAPVVVIDDFLADPHALVEHAASRSCFRPVSGNLYPGIRAPLPLSYMHMLFRALPQIIHKAFGLADLDPQHIEGDFSLVTTRPEELQAVQCLPHIDTTDPNQIAVLHYLCPPHLGGTAFYRHRSTGFESVRAARAECYAASLQGELNALGLPDKGYISGSSPLFEQIASIEAAFNRLIIYRSAVLHSGEIRSGFSFDPDPRSGRLTANAFLHFRGPAATARCDYFGM